ncbi:hypothetical protein WM40_13125 [Robbsia andropogonis]|uniref:Uncharacterized protein n=1 Tax=Robbsia andropogonis TaxID=28092 RepID=A0A0F5JZ71_9BURK|nr:hypothetical protein WM40_13125 [Robbsia andropogonis]
MSDPRPVAATGSWWLTIRVMHDRITRNQYNQIIGWIPAIEHTIRFTVCTGDGGMTLNRRHQPAAYQQRRWP